MKNFIKVISLSFFFAFSVVQIFSTLNAQDKKFRDQAWRIGLIGAVNYNTASLGWQQLHGTDLNFHSAEKNIDHTDGTGLGAYGGIFGEYLSDSWWGFQFRLTYDERNALIEDDTQTPIPSFDTKMNYITFEPFFRVDQHLIPNLNFYVGPFLSANIHGTFDYKPDINKSDKESEVKVSNRPNFSYGVAGGIAYDIKIADVNNKTSMYLTPFVDCSWLLNQRKGLFEPIQNSTNDVWSTVTYRAGIKLSLDFRDVDEKIVQEPLPAIIKYVEVPTGKKVNVYLPIDNTIVTKNVKGYFPIHPYVFFDKGNKEIPSRYIMLSKTDAQSFNESDLGNFTKGDLTVKETNVNQLMITYYNVMNIYADRMRKNPNEQLTLRGCDPLEKDGEAFAKNVKNYLVNIFGIDANRIKIIVEPPKKPSGSAYTDPAFSGLIDDENRRVVFVFSNPEMLRPLPYTIRDESSIDNDMVFFISDDVMFKSWTVSITGENNSMNFGPFKTNRERINVAPLMRGINEGKFNAKVVITLQDGKQVTEDIGFKLLKGKDSKNASRYLMIFDYNKSDAVLTYETKIRKEITPGMNVGNTVVIHGHTDIIGNEASNQKLSQERADQAKRIVDDELGKENKKVNVQAIGIGQTNMQYTFDNEYPEGRMYNRNVFIEIIQ